MAENTKREVGERRAWRMKLRSHEQLWTRKKRPMKEREEEEGWEEKRMIEKDGEAAVRCY